VTTYLKNLEIREKSRNQKVGQGKVRKNGQSYGKVRELGKGRKSMGKVAVIDENIFMI